MPTRKPRSAKPRSRPAAGAGKRAASKSRRTPAAGAHPSEARFESLLELASEWYWEQDERYRFTLLTGAGFGRTGIDSRRS